MNGLRSIKEHGRTAHTLQNMLMRMDTIRSGTRLIDLHWCTRWLKEVIRIRGHSSNINSDDGNEIPETWMPMITQYSLRTQLIKARLN